MTRQSHNIPLRPIDALFIHPERRIYVVYYRGVLWQLPRMKIDEASWQRRRPYLGSTETLYLSRRQSIDDPILAKMLRTLNLPMSVRGITLARFEAWWSMHGLEWLKHELEAGQSPLALHQATTSIKAIDNSPNSTSNYPPTRPNDDNHHISDKKGDQVTTSLASKDVFAEMLADLTNEVLNP